MRDYKLTCGKKPKVLARILVTNYEGTVDMVRDDRNSMFLRTEEHQAVALANAAFLLLAGAYTLEQAKAAVDDIFKSDQETAGPHA